MHLKHENGLVAILTLEEDEITTIYSLHRFQTFSWYNIFMYDNIIMQLRYFYVDGVFDTFCQFVIPLQPPCY